MNVPVVNLVLDADDPAFDELDGANPETRGSTRRDASLPEYQSIALPSSYEADDEPSEALLQLRAKEFELRIGQANDALGEVRLGVAHRTMLFGDVRMSSGYTGNTRAWRHVQAAASAMARQSRIYNLARRTLSRLDPTSPRIAAFQELKPEHLKADTKAMNFNARGTRNAKTSWLWTTDDGTGETNEKVLDGELPNRFP